MGVRRYSVSQLANRFSCVSGIAFGILVVPEVNRIMAVSSGRVLPGRGRGEAFPSCIRSDKISSMQNREISGYCFCRDRNLSFRERE